MWDDTTDGAEEIGRWLDAPIDLDECYGKPTYARCAVALVVWLAIMQPPYWLASGRVLRGGRHDVAA